MGERRKLVTKRPSFPDRVRSLPVSERIERAKSVVEQLTHRVHHVIDVACVSKHFVYLDRLSKQIPRSYAASAFMVTQDALFRQTVIQTAALWDPADDFAISIPTAVLLIDDQDVIRALSREHYNAHADRKASNISPSADPEFEEIIAELMSQHQKRFAFEQSEAAERELTSSIQYFRDIVERKVHKAVHNLRNHFAHSVEKTRLESWQEVPKMKYGEESDLLKASCQVIENLYLWVNGVSFDIKGECWEHSERQASELWGNCNFSFPNSPKR